MTQVTEKRSKSGAVFQKFRISDGDGRRLKRYSQSPRLNSSQSPPQLYIPRQPSPSQHQELVLGLINAMSVGDTGHRMSLFGTFISDIPARIGHNPALDAAVACLISAHSAMMHRKAAGEILNASLYLRAVQTLQCCLEDPKMGMSCNTLCASVLLGLVEVRHPHEPNGLKLMVLGTGGPKARQLLLSSRRGCRSPHGASTSRPI